MKQILENEKLSDRQLQNRLTSVRFVLHLKY